ncbi:lytic transglycosylase domain-containing protein [Agromyces sp. Marseille-P2726]|uniref:lytic transglycosylase domain-containing protein n=1 Tax=Agromyces sp. Marseille-P2726 TaxID=2709132 RepID=UPI00156DE15C|nr:lytic transglycosylase domain-containing protein [Agromyces sp. Marseille-P2726]
MSWDDDFDADEYGVPREGPARGRGAGWRVARRALGYAGAVVGVVALAAGAVYAVSTVGLAAKPGGFSAPAAYGPSVALPPLAPPTARAEQGGGGQSDTLSEQQPAAVSESPLPSVPVVDPEWTSRIAEATGIPQRALLAYALAHVALAEEEPECGIDWATIAAIGSVESRHGSHGGRALDENGSVQPAIIGRALDGDGVAKIADTDGGLLDGDTSWDRAVGPMQFIPSTWAKWGSDANGDGMADPNQIDDAAQAAARYLCASGSMTSPEGWRAAVYSYNHDNDYVDKVARVANEYAAASSG